MCVSRVQKAPVPLGSTPHPSLRYPFILIVLTCILPFFPRHVYNSPFLSALYQFCLERQRRWKRRWREEGGSARRSGGKKVEEEKCRIKE